MKTRWTALGMLFAAVIAGGPASYAQIQGSPTAVGTPMAPAAQPAPPSPASTPMPPDRLAQQKACLKAADRYGLDAPQRTREREDYLKLCNAKPYSEPFTPPAWPQ